MANLFSLYATLFLLSTTSALMVMVASDTCKEDFGACSDDCSNRCASAHQGGQGKCEPGRGGQEDCWCFYDCPPLKTCEDGFPALGGCDGQQCDAECVAKHPGRGAEGYCYSLGDPVYDSCRCKYFC